ncbi:MAG TPA: class B sortase [Candidatus Limiplasma sp.]|nr:class B sortase [Candidatus Limiplasma sp.]
MKRFQAIARKLVIGCCVACMVFSGYHIVAAVVEYNRDRGYYNTLKKTKDEMKPSVQEVLNPQSSVGTANTQKSTEANTNSGSASATPEQNPQRDTTASTADEQNTPLNGQVATGSLDFGPLKTINTDVAAWLTCSDTIIDYPVVQGKDNQYYLKHLFDGQEGKAGTLFIDAENKPNFGDQNTVVFGHHMRDGSMFASLAKYLNQDYYDHHKTMTLYTPNGDYTIQIFAAYTRDAKEIQHHFDSSEAFMDYIASARRNSKVTSTVQINANDRMITLCTCAYTFSNARYIVQGILTPVGL